jgi:hypothetical protein
MLVAGLPSASLAVRLRRVARVARWPGLSTRSRMGK